MTPGTAPASNPSQPPVENQPLRLELAGVADENWLRWTWACVAVGLVVRGARYLLGFPLWGDEISLAYNFLDRGYSELLQPLDYTQVAPIGFLFAERAVLDLWGWSEYTLRLVPFLCSVAGLLLFRALAVRLLSGLPLLLAVGLFAVSYHPIRHAAEVKPYAVDTTVAVAVLLLAVTWWQTRRDRWLWCLAATAPLAVAGSFPAVFVLGGASLAMLPLVWSTRRVPTWAAYAAWNLAIVASFAGVFLLFTRQHYSVQYDAGMASYWDAAFLPWDRPGTLPGWLLDAFTGHAFAYPLGGEHGGSLLTTLAFGGGLVVAWRSGQRTWVRAVAATIVLALIAAALKKYPFGGSPRLMQYFAPFVCLSAAVGLAELCRRLPSPQAKRRAAFASAACLLALAAGLVAYDVSHPFKTPGDARRREFARWFWREVAPAEEVRCIVNDLGQTPAPGGSSRYLVEQRLYFDRTAAATPLPQAGASDSWRCVVWHDLNRRRPAHRDWLREMESQYRVVRRHRYDVNVDSKHPERFEVYEFTPLDRPSAVTARR